jgi:hypothetical protein
MTQRFLLVLGLFLIVSGCVGTSTGTGSNGTTTGSGTTTVNISNVSVTGTVTDSSGSALTNVDVYVTESERNDWGDYFRTNHYGCTREL